GYDLNTRILAGQRHLSATGPSAHPIPLNTQGRLVLVAADRDVADDDVAVLAQSHHAQAAISAK
ncbi:hypothetical protein, partial [Streptomyces cinereoruber]|uniref:hypothetical protein n=1 Tax=Streptomyces cinereoruber TaxID=67260 RepID=UPI0036391AA9